MNPTVSVMITSRSITCLRPSASGPSPGKARLLPGNLSRREVGSSVAKSLSSASTSEWVSEFNKVLLPALV